MFPDDISEISIIKHRSNLLPRYYATPHSWGSGIYFIHYPMLTHGALLNFCGKFLVFDVQSSTTEKEQTVSYPMFLKIGAPVSGAGTD